MEKFFVLATYTLLYYVIFINVQSVNVAASVFYMLGASYVVVYNREKFFK